MPIDPNLETIIKEARLFSAVAWQGTVGTELRPWLDFGGTDVEKFDFEKLFELFERKKSNDDYLKERTSDNPKAKGVWVPKMCSDLLSGFQRDQVLRTRSRIRYMMHSALRERTNGQDSGGLTVHTTALMARIEAAEEK